MRAPRKPQQRSTTHLAEVNFCKAEFPKRLRALRQERGFTLDQLGAAIGSNRPALWRLESGRWGVTLPTLVRLSLALGCSVGYLSGFDDVALRCDRSQFTGTSDVQA